MGEPMGRRLLEAGFDLTVWNRSPFKATGLQQLGARAAATAAQAAAGVDVVVTMLSNGAAVSDVLASAGVAQAITEGALFIDMSSVPPETAREHATMLARKNVAALDAPVSGGVVGAAEGTLAIMVGGDADAFVRAAPIFAALGRATHVGPAGTGALAKLANQMIVGITMGAVAEALLLAEAGGADPAAVRDAIRGGFAESRVLELHGARMLARNFVPGAHIMTQIKDLASALDVARAVGLQLPLTHGVHELYSQFARSGGASLDHSAILVALEQLNARSR